MLYSEAPRFRAPAFPSAPTAVAALAHLRQASFPRLIEPPRFIPRTRGLRARPRWASGLLELVSGQAAVFAALAALALTAVTALPAWAAFTGESPAPRTSALSSAGTAGSSATRVEDLSVGTFVGGIPYVQQLRYLDALSAGAPAASRFVEGARQASLAAYLQEVSGQVALPYVSHAAATNQAIEAWSAAVEEAKRQAALQAAVARGRVAGRVRAAWQAPPITPGIRLPATVTFYACVGDGFCGNTASGQPVFEGAAACSSNLPFGTRFVVANDPSGRVFVCVDRGALAATWVDVWFYDADDGWAWQSQVGTRSDIIIVQ